MPPSADSPAGPPVDAPGLLHLATRPLPFRAGLTLVLAETAAVLLWALDADAEPRDETWLFVDPAATRLEAGVPVQRTDVALPEGLLSHAVKLGPGRKVSSRLVEVRDSLVGACYVRIHHDPQNGEPTFCSLHAPPRVAAPRR